MSQFKSKESDRKEISAGENSFTAVLGTVAQIKPEKKT